MKEFAGRIAVITGGGTGMGRELARQLVAEGCNVAICDVSAANMAETMRLCQADGAAQGTRITAHVVDVSDEAQMQRFRDEVVEQHRTDCIHLLFNNAGIGGGGSFIKDSRADWERTFNVDWGGVYLGVRTFLPLLMAAEEGHIVNTSSVCGFWATSGPQRPNTAYAAAKFAIKGFTEALVTDLRTHAPHIKCSVVMPGHVGTAIIANSRKIRGGHDSDALTPQEVAQTRARLAADGKELSDAAVQTLVADLARNFQEDAPVSAAQAATIILDGVRGERWRVLVGEDAKELDRRIRSDPESAYELEFFDSYSQSVNRVKYI